MRQWPARRWVAAVLAAAVALLVVGVPTGIIRTDFYTRMTAVTWWDYPIWAASGVLTGLVVATYVRTPLSGPRGSGRLAGGGLLTVFAVGCPICNKLVVAVLGVSGALNIWAPLQPFLGVSSLGLLAVALVARMRGERSCPVAVGS